MKNLKTARYELSDEDWERLKPLFQKTLGKLWRTRQEKDRVILNGLLWKLATGAPWRALPKKYGYWGTANQRLKRLKELGLWRDILAELSKTKTPNQS